MTSENSRQSQDNGQSESNRHSGNIRQSDKSALRSHLGILAATSATHGTGHADDIPLPRLPGFVESAFSPLAFEVARRCLTERPGDSSRTAVVLASLMGDSTTADLASSRVVSGRVHNPLLFMQATANSVLGHTSREFGITGQMFSLSTLDDPVTELLTMADLLLEDPELDRVLVVGVELGGGERLAAAYRDLVADSDRPVPDLPGSAALAAAVLLGRPDAGTPVTIRAAEAPAPTARTRHPGSVEGLFDLVTAHRRLLDEDGGKDLPVAPSFALTTNTLPERTGRIETETHAHQ